MPPVTATWLPTPVRSAATGIFIAEMDYIHLATTERRAAREQ